MDKITLKEVVDNFTWQLTDYDRPDKSLVNIPVKHMRMLIGQVESMPCEGTWCTGGKIPTVEGWQDCDLCNGSGRKWEI